MATEDPERHWDALARAVRERRLELGITSQKAAAELAGIHVNTWNALENGKAVRMDSLESVTRVLEWPSTYVMAVLRGEDPGVYGQLRGVLPGLQGGAAASVSATPTGGEGAAVTARPATVRGKASIPGPKPPVRPSKDRVTVMPLTPELSSVVVVVPLEADIIAELDQDDLAWMFHTLQGHGIDLAKGIVQAKRAERYRHGFETTSEWAAPGGDTHEHDEEEGR